MVLAEEVLTRLAARFEDGRELVDWGGCLRLRGPEGAIELGRSDSMVLGMRSCRHGPVANWQFAFGERGIESKCAWLQGLLIRDLG